MANEAKKAPASFYRTSAGHEPVREWLQGLSKQARIRIGTDIATVEYGWPVGMPTCRPLGGGLWETRTDLPDGRTARVLFCFHDGRLVLLHAFIKKSRRTPRTELELARTRQREVVT